MSRHPRLGVGGNRLDHTLKRLATQLAVCQGRYHFLKFHLVHRITLPFTFYQRLPDWFSSMGLTFADIASRARKILERTVPIGQFITSAISS